VASHLELLKEYREQHISHRDTETQSGESNLSASVPLCEKNTSALSGKLDIFFELLDEAIDGGHRVLVFSQFVSMLTILRRELEARGIAYCYLDGSTKDRLGECRRFNTDESIPLFLISLHAGGTGLNLTGADMVVHFDPWWNPAVEDQATDRAHRIGQKRTVYVVKMIAEGSVEERVLALQQKKQLVIDATVGTTDAQAIQKLTYDDVKAIVGL
jgi:SNF2 family DNA or RNA helicase